MTALDDIERSITDLVRQAPALDERVIAELIDRLREVGSPLSLSIARVVELVGEQLVPSGVALPALAMACATLADGVRGKLTDREQQAARYEIETLLPVPDPPVRVTLPDVELSALTRGPRPRT